MDKGTLDKARYLDVSIVEIERFIEGRKNNQGNYLKITNNIDNFYYISNKEIEKKILEILIDYKKELIEKLNKL